MSGPPTQESAGPRQGSGIELPEETPAGARAPAVLWVAVALGALLSAWLALEGLSARLFGQLPALTERFELWALLLRRSRTDPASLGWPLVVIGTTWWGALAGVWIRHRWGWPCALLLGVISLLFLGPSTLVAACLLAILLLPAIRTWRS